jgi:hypothetical protein
LFSQKISKKPLVGGKSAPSTSSKRLKNPDLKFLELEHSNDKLSMRSETAKKDTKRIVKRFGELSAVYAELGMVFNAFSLHETGHEHLARGIEKLGQAMDSAHLTTNSFVSLLSIISKLIIPLKGP